MSTLGLGLMSGTSLDGVDAALVRFEGDGPRAELVAFRATPYEPAFRERLQGVLAHGTVRDLALLHAELGRHFAAAARAVLGEAGVAPTALDFVASHGQTVWHEPGVVSLQLGDPAVIAEALGVPVVSDFRSRDVAAGGQGAPLVPVADALLFADPARPRILLNVGGMANVTWVPAGGDPTTVRAFDTGPGVAVLDAVTRSMRPGLPFDRDGLLAAAGRPHAATVTRLLTHPYFALPPPKTTGREQFGDAYAAALVRDVRAAHPEATDEDCVATAVALTVGAIADQLTRWLPADGAELVASGGGVHHPVLFTRLRDAVAPRAVRRFDELFFDGDAKEAVAFALLGWLRLRGRAGNVPAATGAAGARVLGDVTG